MIVISHRGLWLNESEKNSLSAFRRSFERGFGTETDIRDYCGELVISHDIATSKCILLEEFFSIYKDYGADLPLALNIKSDGLQKKLLEFITRHQVINYFVFDMAVPDGLGYIKNRLRTYTRQSEIETIPSFYDMADGVWLDEFNSHWINSETILGHIQHGKGICIVSPDLHGRSFEREWDNYKTMKSCLSLNHLMICTDHPEKAERFFNGN